MIIEYILARISAGCLPASFYHYSTSPLRSSSTTGYNSSISGSVSPSNPYSQAFGGNTVGTSGTQAASVGLHGLYSNSPFHHSVPTTSPLATTNNGTTTQDPYTAYAAQAQAAYAAQAFGHNSYNPQTSVSGQAALHPYNQLSQLSSPAASNWGNQQDNRVGTTPSFASGNTGLDQTKFNPF